MRSTYLFSLKRPCGSLKVRVQQIWLGDVRSGTPGTSETGTIGGLLHRFPELSPLEGTSIASVSQGARLGVGDTLLLLLQATLPETGPKVP
jgi:hypothetical protein